MQLSALLKGFAPVPQDATISGLSLDSRTVEPGDLFVALAGSRQHGLVHLDEAVDRGCAAVLWEPDEQARSALDRHQAVPAVAMPHLAEKLGEIASRFFGDPSARMCVIGVTGTNGKSSFVHLLSRALDRRAPAATLGTLGVGPVGAEKAQRHTTPDAIAIHRELADLIAQGIISVAMEVSSHALHQRRVDGVSFDGAVFTNLSRDHLDYHQDMDAYANAKARLFTWNSLEFAILNADDAQVGRFRAAVAPAVTVVEYGLSAGTVQAEELRFERTGMVFRLVLPQRSAMVHTALLGRFNVYNLLAVAATLHAIGWSISDIAEALSASEPVRGRMNAIQRPGMPVVVVDYAHTPDALEQCLQAVREHGYRQITCVFGCGGDRDRGKRPLMAAAAEAGADRLVITDDNPRTEDGDAIVADMLKGLRQPDRAQVIRDRGRAIREAIRAAGAEDLVLIAGKGHEDYQEVGDQRHHFDDRETALAELGAEP